MKPLYIFDLDGTLADKRHRLPIIDPEEISKAIEFDAPIVGPIETMMNLREGKCAIRIWTGREIETLDATLAWLHRQTNFSVSYLSRILRMRPAGDTQPDHSLKQQWLLEMGMTDRVRLIAVFEDNDKVVAMWRENNVVCFQTKLPE